MTYALVIGAALGGILLFLLAVASANTTLFAQHYPLLLALNAVSAIALVGLVAYQLVTLRRQLKARVFGARLSLRMLTFLAVMAIVPGVLVYTVSVQFLTKSIESWFDVRVEAALESGLGLGRTALDNMLNDLRAKARGMALELSDVPAGRQIQALNRLREQAAVDEVVLFAATGQVLGIASRQVRALIPEPPPAAALRQARASRDFAAAEPDGDRGLRMRVIVPLQTAGLGDESRYLQLLQPVPASLSDSAETVQDVYRDYRELSLLRTGLKRIYLVTLTLTLLLALFSAVALAFVLSRRLSEPLAQLAEATAAVARGDFTARARVTSRDELGVLTRSFNSMTSQLDEARAAADASRVETESAKAYLENILANLSAGVLTFGPDFRLNIANAGASEILRQDVGVCSGGPLGGSPELDVIAGAIHEGFAEQPDADWQREIELPTRDQVLLLRATPLPEAAGGGYVVVFDDITQLVAAQRATAWGEVARRLAHEIKNPLTPIQLSAERLQAKLDGKLAPEDAQTLQRATQTIVNQVTAMKHMVDDFTDYARLPLPTLAALDLNQLVTEVLSLYEESRAVVIARLGENLPLVLGDATQLRQVIHNLLQNAEDALAGREEPRIEVRTERAGSAVRLCVLDNGAGFPEGVMKRVFEPYVTTKPKGTGLGLAIVKKIIDEHHGTVNIENRARAEDRGGAAVTIALPLAA
jgi:nitrogen fixation/metabolism regulation signal transduction histidine kinase